jgi:predicted amidohydrolase YtcJ
MTKKPKKSMQTVTVFTARKIITMDPSLPNAAAVAISEGRIMAVGDLASMEPWFKGRNVTVDDRFADKVLMPGFIDNHVHPFLGAILTPMEIIAPEPWRMAGGDVHPAANTPEQYEARLRERLAARTDTDELFISFGYQPLEHGKMCRPELDVIAPDRPVILFQRSFHETYMNSAALVALGLTEETVGDHPQVDLAQGHFFETGNMMVTGKLMSVLLKDDWYRKGLGITCDLMLQGGITTAADMLFGTISPDFELAAIDAVIEKPERPLRIVNVFDGRGFSNRASKRGAGAPDAEIDFAAGLKAMEELLGKDQGRVRYLKAVKLFADGAMFSALMQMNEPGYMDGHEGEWIMTPDILANGVKHFWEAGYQIHVHVNGDKGMDSVLDALAKAQEAKPRFDHRFMMHHVGFHTNEQSTRMAALGAHASVNPYYIHALSDTLAELDLGPERAGQLVRSQSILRNNMRVSFHSDFMMAPLEPLFLAWCAGARVTRSGQQVSPEERLSLEQSLRGITIDAAFGLGMDDEIGSIVAGKKADFAVLEDDPYDLGVDRLKDVRVAGVVFEGAVTMLTKSVASVCGETGLMPVPDTPHDHSEMGPKLGQCSHELDSCGHLQAIAAWMRAMPEDVLGDRLT